MNVVTGTRRLGRSGIEVSALGMGCWAIGGPWEFNGGAAGWSRTDDDESVRALRRALELGVNLFDTAANYGAGHSERLLARAFAGHREEVVIATKFGYAVDEAASSVRHYDASEEHSDVASRVRSDLEASLRRLDTDHVDVYLLHVGGLSIERATDVAAVLEDLVIEGKVRTYGWSTDRTDAVAAFATGSGCGVVEQGLSVLDEDDGSMLRLCDERDLASLIRGPLGMGLLTGKFTATSTFPADDQRAHAEWHPGFHDGRPTSAWLSRVDAVREVLRSDGRTLAQGALAWLWARSGRTIPIPGFRTVAQVEENAAALVFGPLSETAMRRIDELLGRQAMPASQSPSSSNAVDFIRL